MTLANTRVAFVAVAVGFLGAAAAAPTWARQEPEAAPPDAGGAAARADDALQAGTDVPAPKRKRLVLPEYPEEAKALGIRGIVLLELTIERDGHVGDVRVTRSIPELDSAAVEAVRQWEYEVTEADGKPVRVRLTVPITFSMRLPEIERETGIPELRQGVLPAFPASGGSRATVEADVTLDPNGRVAEALVTSGETPWAEALLRAVRTWVFNWNDPNAILAFRVKAEFERGRQDDDSVVKLHASKPQRLEVFAPGLPPDAPAPPAAAPADTANTPATAPADTAPPAPVEPAEPASDVAEAAPAAPPQPGDAAEAPTTAPEPSGEAPPAPAPEAGPAPAPEPQAETPPAPPVEVIRVPRPEPAQPVDPTAPVPAPPEPPKAGFSSVQGVLLGLGVPDLVQGRRPIVPPFARMAGTAGQVEVSFSVGVSGTTSIQSVTGLDVFKPAAEQMLATWLFRRTTTERLYLVATIDYGAETATATVALIP